MLHQQGPSATPLTTSPELQKAILNLHNCLDIILRQNSTVERLEVKKASKPQSYLSEIFSYYLDQVRKNPASQNTGLSEKISNKENVIALAQACDMIDLRKFNHQRLIVTEHDAGYWAARGLTGYELIAHFVARRVTVICVVMSGGEIENQGVLSYLAGERDSMSSSEQISTSSNNTILGILLELAKSQAEADKF
jgi:hypothetical protein